MASTIVQFASYDGLTLTLKLYAEGSDTIANGAGGDSCTEATNRNGTYQATVTEALAGIYDARITDANDNTIQRYKVKLADDTSTYECVEPWIQLVDVENVRQASAANLATAISNYSATRGLTGTAVPAAAAGAPNGLPVSDAGGLDLDAILADTNELQTNQGNWLTATGFSTHDAAAVVTALGTGSTLTDCLTATGFMLSTEDGSSFTAIPDMATATNQATIVGYIDTEVGTIITHLTDIKGAGFITDTHSLPQCVTATGFSTHDAAAVVTSMGTGSTLTAVPWNASWDAEVQSEVTDALNAYDPPTRTEATADKDAVLAILGTPDGADLAADLVTIDGVVDAIKLVTDLLNAADSEPTGVPAVNETPLVKLAYLFMALRNQVDVTGTTKSFYDDGGAAEWKKTLSDDGSTYSEGEAAAP